MSMNEQVSSMRHIHKMEHHWAMKKGYGYTLQRGRILKTLSSVKEARTDRLRGE